MHTTLFSNRISEISLIYSLISIFMYVFQRNNYIILTTRSSFRGWSELQNILRAKPRTLDWEEMALTGWCPHGNHTSPQCACFQNYHTNTYIKLSKTWNGSNETLGNQHASQILSNCLSKRPSWRKETCGDFCRIHILIPIILCNLYLLIFFSKITLYRNYYLSIISKYIPYLLALGFVVIHLIFDKSGAIFATLSVLSVIFEVEYFCKFSFEGHIYWSFHRFFVGALAVQCALVFSARDIFQIICYGMLGFFAGLLAYIIFLVRQGIPCKHDTNVCLHLWIGLVSILSSFVFLIQQNWLDFSHMRSSYISPLVLIIAVVQCVLQTPYMWVPTEIHMSITIVLITVSMLTLISDLYE
jgi:hypothetical protein